MTVLGFIGKNVDVSGNSLFLALYTTWLFLVGFISMSYTNILPSLVVVPSVHVSSLTFEDMMAKNFSFECDNWRWIKNRAAGQNLTPWSLDGQNNGTTGRVSVIDQENVLAEPVTDIVRVSSWTRRTEMSTERN